MRAHCKTKIGLKSARRRSRGAALIIALVLAICITMLVVATQMLVTSQLKSEKGQRDYDRALEMAEAGANAYLNYLATGNNNSITPWTTAPPPTITSGIPSIAQIQADIRAHRIILGNGSNTVGGTAYANTMGLVNFPAQATLATYPPKNSQFGYFVVLTSLSQSSVNMVSYGYSNGIVRRVQVGGTSSDIFDWAALWGINPSDAWNVNGSLTVVGGFGGSGVMSWGNNTRFYDGPGIASGVNWPNNTPPTPWGSATSGNGTSSPNDPPGHIGYGTLASPFARSVPRSLVFPTVDTDANNVSGTALKAEYFRTHNNNFTGIRYLVTRSGVITELTSTNYTVTGKNHAAASTLSELNNGDDSYTLSGGGNNEFSPTLPNNGSWGNLSTDTFYGIRIYPGIYFFESISMSPSDILNIRSYNNYDRTNTSMTTDTSYLGFRPTNDPVNPTSGLDDSSINGRRDIRMYIGHSAKNTNGSQDTLSTFTNGCNMEYYRYPSRFRVFISTLSAASNKSITVKGSSNSNLPAAFNVNMLVYNKESGVNSGNEYGYIGFSSGTYLRGSLIAWHVDGAGGNTVEKAAAEGAGGGSQSGSSDRLVYQATSWKELP